MSKPRILVVGASIAGPTAAYWFAKGGADVTVIERFPELRTGGQNVDIRTAGVTVMRRIEGMEAAVRAQIVEIDGIHMVREDGRPFASFQATGNPDQQSLISEYEILRGDLSRVLYDLTKDHESIRYVFGEQVASLQHHEGDDGPITAEFANGYPTVQYDLVVACDGATSRTRAMGLGCGLRDHVTSLNSWAAYYSITQDLVQGSKAGWGYNAVGGRVCFLGRDPHGTGNRVCLMGMKPASDHATVVQFREAAKDSDETLKQFLDQHYRGAGWKMDAVLDGLQTSDDLYGSEIVQVKLPSLSKGRFTLVGDAGYAPGTTGTGTTLALAGAYVLAGEITTHKGDFAAGLKAYEERMRPLIADMQQVPSLLPLIMAPQTAWGLWLRNHIMAFVSWSGIITFAQRYFASAFASSDKYGLPDYDWTA